MLIVKTNDLFVNSKEVRTKKRKRTLQEQKPKDRNISKQPNSKSNDFDDKSRDSEEKSPDKIKSGTDEDTKDSTNVAAMDEGSHEESALKVCIILYVILINHLDFKHQCFIIFNLFLQYPWQTGKHGFSWPKYLEHNKTKGAPIRLFKDAFPYSKNNFKVGMKLEGIDPNHPSHYCVLTVAEIIGK